VGAKGRVEGGVTIVTVTGRYYGPDGIDEFERVLGAAVSRSGSRVVLDLSDVKYIDAIWLEVLARAYGQARQAGSEIKLCGLRHERVRSVLKLTRLVEIFDVHDSVDSALKAFAGPTTSRHESDVTIVTAARRYPAGAAVAEFDRVLGEAVDRPGCKVILELSDLEFAGSAWFGVLIKHLRGVKFGGGEIKLCAPSTRIRHLLSSIPWPVILEVHDTVEEALRAFA